MLKALRRSKPQPEPEVAQRNANPLRASVPWLVRQADSVRLLEKAMEADPLSDERVVLAYMELFAAKRDELKAFEDKI